MDKLRYMKVQLSNCVTLTVLWQQLRHVTLPCLQRISNQLVTIILTIFIAVVFSLKNSTVLYIKERKGGVFI